MNNQTYRESLMRNMLSEACVKSIRFVLLFCCGNFLFCNSSPHMQFSRCFLADRSNGYEISHLVCECTSFCEPSTRFLPFSLQAKMGRRLIAAPLLFLMTMACSDNMSVRAEVTSGLTYGAGATSGLRARLVGETQTLCPKRATSGRFEVRVKTVQPSFTGAGQGARPQRGDRSQL